MNSTFGLPAAYRKHLPANWACEKAYECMGYRIKPRATLLDQQCWELLCVGSGLQTDARTPSYHCWPIARSYCVAVSKETMCKARSWFQQCWKSCANGSNIVALLTLQRSRNKGNLGTIPINCTEATRTNSAVWLGCEQALLFGRVKRVSLERARGRGKRVLARLASLAEIRELARRLWYGQYLKHAHNQYHSGIGSHEQLFRP